MITGLNSKRGPCNKHAYTRDLIIEHLTLHGAKEMRITIKDGQRKRRNRDKEGLITKKKKKSPPKNYIISYIRNTAKFYLTSERSLGSAREAIRVASSASLAAIDC